MRASPFDAPELPADFWYRHEVRHALQARDMGALFRLIWSQPGVTQFQIATATEMSQGRVSKIVNGQQSVAHLAVIRRIADGLGIPHHARVLLGLAPTAGSAMPAPRGPAKPARQASAPASPLRYPATAGQAASSVSGLWRGDAEQAQDVMSLPADPSAWNAAALAWLVGRADNRLPEPRATRRVGLADVVRVRETSKMFAQLDNRFGGAHSRRPLVQYLRGDAAALLQGTYSDEVGRELFATVAESTLLAAWMSYDCGLHGLAQRYFVHALRLADTAGDKRLGCSILSAMSHQAAFLGHLAEAADLARAALAGSQAVATPTMTAQFQSMEARALARLGDRAACTAALAATEASFQRKGHGDDPEFITYFNEAELAAEFAHCFRDLGDHGSAAQYAARAVSGSDGTYQRSDFFVSMVLAAAYAGQDDPEQACTTALQALRLGEGLTSARCAAYLRDFRDRLERFASNPVVKDFHDQAAVSPLWLAAG